MGLVPSEAIRRLVAGVPSHLARIPGTSLMAAAIVCELSGCQGARYFPSQNRHMRRPIDMLSWNADARG